MPREIKAIMAVIAMLLLASIGEGVLWWTRLRKKAAIQGEIEVIDGDIKSAQGEVAQKPDLEARRDVLQKNVDEYMQFLPSERVFDVNDQTRKISEYAQKSGLELRKFDQTAREEPKRAEKGPTIGFVQFQYRILLSGTFPGVVDFLNRLENHAALYRIDSFSLSPARGEAAVDGHPMLDVSVDTSAFTYFRAAEH